MLFPEIYCVDAAFEPARDVLTDYLTRLTGRAPAQSGFCVRLTLLAPDENAQSISGDERFSIDCGESGVLIEAYSARGAMFAAYAFLEDFLGVRYLTAETDFLPPVPELFIGKKDYAPAFSYRELYWRGALDGRFALKLRLNSARANIPDALGGRVRFFNYSHTFEQLVPPDEYFDAHPEYFALVNGKRQKEKSQLCLTNRDVLALCIEKVRLWMREHLECTIFSVAQNDWYGFCTCDACKALDAQEGSHAGSILHFVNAIADAIKDEFPNNFLHTFAYLYSRAAPKTVKPRDNVIVRLCSIECCFSHPMETCDSAIAQIDVEEGCARVFQTGERLFKDDLKAWGSIAKNLFIWDYTTNYANYLQPFPNLSVLQKNLRLMRANGVSGVFEQGNYAPGQTSAFAALKIYVLSHLLWNPDADEDALIEDFMRCYFGKAAAPLLQYIKLMEESAQHAHMGIFDAPDAPAISDEALKKGRELMARALECCETEAQRNRVALEALSPDYLYLARLPLDAPNRTELADEFARRVQALHVTELFERRALKESLECLKNSRFCRDRANVPYACYRL